MNTFRIQPLTLVIFDTDADPKGTVRGHRLFHRARQSAITKLFPEYAVTRSTESVDQIEVDNEEAVQLVKDIWTEVLVGGQDEEERYTNDCSAY